jgi:glycosyltransferase involved in cell wall biosynthesis
VKVIYLSDAGVSARHDPGFGQPVAWDIDLLGGYPYRVLRSEPTTADDTFWSRHHDSLTAVLAEERPDWILLNGYASRMNWVAVRWAKQHGVSVAYYSDSNIRLVRKRFPAFVGKRLLLKWYFARIDAFLSPGEANRDYLRLFGADERRIRWCPFAIDVNRFKAACAEPTLDVAHFVWAGKMIGLKRPVDFVDALSALVARGRNPLRARMIGAGPMLETVQAHAARVLPPGVLTFSGFVNQSRMPLELCRGPVFVFTSEADQYGLAVTEAAACGRALVVANVNGCVGPTGPARDQSNAMTYEAGDVAALADCMDHLYCNPEKIREMQLASALVAADHDVARAAAAMEEVIAGTPKVAVA